MDAQAPAWWEGWRARLTLTTARSNRMGYYGLGNDTPYAVESLTTAGPYFYRVSRTSTTARATVQHRVFGPVRLLFGAALAHSTFRALPGPRDRKSVV